MKYFIFFLIFLIFYNYALRYRDIQISVAFLYRGNLSVPQPSMWWKKYRQQLLLRMNSYFTNQSTWDSLMLSMTPTQKKEMANFCWNLPRMFMEICSFVWKRNNVEVHLIAKEKELSSEANRLLYFWIVPNRWRQRQVTAVMNWR